MVPLDGSPLAEQALPHAIALARTFDAALLLVSVTQPPPEGATSIDSAEWRLARAGTWAYLERTADRISKLGIETDWTVAEGLPPEEILRFADDHQADVIVLCTHGSGGLTEFRLSGTVSKVLHTARCSVLIVPAVSSASTEIADAAYERILAPVDCTRRAEWAAHLAGSIARAHSAELMLATVIERPRILGDVAARARAGPVAENLARMNREAARRHLQTLADAVSGEGPRVRRIVTDADHTGQALVDMAERECCSLIVLSAHGSRPALNRPFGAVPGLLLENATTPVLMLKDAASSPHRSGVAADTAVAGLPRRWT